MKFYHANNCTRSITHAGIAFQFAPYELTGTWLGVYATDKADEISALDEVVKNPKSGITSISQEEYDRSIVTKKSAQGTYADTLARHAPTPGEKAAPPTAPVDTAPNTPAAEPPPTPLASVDAAVEVVPVQKKVKK
jgi:hypothetical protein